MPTDAERFADHLESIFGEADVIHMVKEPPDGGPAISVFVYRDIPEPGMITGITYGLSLCKFEAWRFSRPEMIVCMESTHLDWPLSAASFVAMFRGHKPFQYGDLYTTDAALAPDTQMKGFLIFAQSLLDEAVASVELSHYTIRFSQFYPIYLEEIEAYRRMGLEAFFKHPNFDIYNTCRPRISI